MDYKDLVLKYGNGLMSKTQYESIAETLQPLCPCNLLVFGLGEDSNLWHNLNMDGNTVFLEDDEGWISKFKDYSFNVQHVQYHTYVKDFWPPDPTKINEESIKLDLPQTILDKKWDFIIVDAPLGHQPPRPFNGPGRVSSIYTASLLIKENGIVVIDDYKRPVEKTFSNFYFGTDNILKTVEGKVTIFKT